MEADLINAEFVRELLTMRATVYTRGANGQYTTAVKSDLACRLDPVSANSAASVPDRAALASLGVFRWDATYDLPETAVQLAVDAFPNVRWSPQSGTAWPDSLPGIGTVGKSVQVQRA